MLSGCHQLTMASEFPYSTTNHLDVLKTHSEGFINENEFNHPTERSNWIEGQPPEWNASLVNDHTTRLVDRFHKREQEISKLFR